MRLFNMMSYMVLLFGILLSPAVFAVANKGNAMAGRWYFGAELGPTLSAHGDTQVDKFNLVSYPEYKSGYLLGVNFGYHFVHPFSIEGELNYNFLPFSVVRNAIPGKSVEMINSATTVTALLVNGYYEVRSLPYIVPYIGFGLGIFDVNTTLRPNPPVPQPSGGSVSKKSLSFTGFGYQGIVGVDYRINQKVALGIRYKYLSSFNETIKGRTNLGFDGYQTHQRVTSNVLAISLRYYLD